MPDVPTVLAVDDTPANLKLLEAFLVRQRCQVVMASSGEEALQKIAVRAPDLVLLDIVMPGIDGYTVLRRLKGDPTTRHIPVIMISALDTLGSVVQCIEHGAEDYLPKPFEPALLRARVGACLEKKRLADLEVRYLAEVDLVAQAAERVEEGRYQPGSLSEIGGRDDRLGRLARVFDTVVTQLLAREAGLRAQIESLRSEVAQAQSAGVPRTMDAEPPARFAVGHVLAGRYEIISCLGSGGMGWVFKANDRELDELIALKMLRPELVTDPVHIERFKAEIRTGRHLAHPNVVRIYDLGEAEGFYYLTMECVEGMTVRDLINSRGRLEVSAVLALGHQLAQALASAHERGVVHRDVKPENLLVDADGVLKVMDFGIAWLAKRPDTLTQDGLVIGTPAYMPPEQLLDSIIDERVDLYAAGVVLYECATGTLPYPATSLLHLVAQILNGKPTPLIEINAAIPPALSALIMRLIASDPNARPASAGELATLLAQLA